MSKSTRCGVDTEVRDDLERERDDLGVAGRPHWYEGVLLPDLGSGCGCGGSGGGSGAAAGVSSVVAASPSRLLPCWVVASCRLCRRSAIAWIEAVTRVSEDSVVSRLLIRYLLVLMALRDGAELNGMLMFPLSSPGVSRAGCSVLVG